ncbi:MAG: formyltetrahydrofolate deformylase [Actinobacteria bacterium]|nr:formyltetrahydrofolate deformylase [Actinomycetota bacterium]
MTTSAVLLLSCPDRRGLVAAVADFVAGHGGNVLHADQHIDVVGDRPWFFQRVEFSLDGMDLPRAELEPTFRRDVADRLDMAATLRFSDERTPTAILASRQPHCLTDLLMRWYANELSADVRVVVSNHPDHAELCAALGIPYVHEPVDDGSGGKPVQEERVLATLAEHGVELVVMARYMQILSPSFIAAYPNRIINIHHSFLPAFVGANPYRQAHDRGVKLIGATAHYATDDLDEGPIIEQETARVNHRDDVARLTRAGRDLETIVLARAVRAHLEHRVLVHGRKTVVF